MTNLYDFLRYIREEHQTGDVTLSPEQLQFLEEYLSPPDVIINFKAHRVGGTDDDPVMAQDFQIAGDGLEVFCLITEALMNNYQFAQIIQKAVAFYREHIPTCPICAPKHFGAIAPANNWIFSHVKPEKDGK
jgi:hypothetical protein